MNRSKFYKYLKYKNIDIDYIAYTTNISINSLKSICYENNYLKNKYYINKIIYCLKCKPNDILTNNDYKYYFEELYPINLLKEINNNLDNNINNYNKLYKEFLNSFKYLINQNNFVTCEIKVMECLYKKGLDYIETSKELNLSLHKIYHVYARIIKKLHLPKVKMIFNDGVEFYKLVDKINNLKQQNDELKEIINKLKNISNEFNSTINIFNYESNDINLIKKLLKIIDEGVL